ncbi:50S ribosomal protein L22 [Candidatus Peregrinibacteria bacterium]|jgi:large subunit ribosomal protein L22|nr:50S ribosomal protein L22 [Candidatus Peregrinibacteria bacterium]MBT4631626.1 50S ribosomal protein L22 [Candidatus Peregrinibacteria bacterium]MBT5516754.1 50S ribosomal protein L22 [Candidatus Peregrinibacteria bacterium]MBT5823964.1 50S ribosomal protein L22 [Candidatus Peregrinibacteria bacterium]
MKAILRNSSISSKKANLVAGLVRGAMVEDALAQLRFTPKKAAAILSKVIKSAAANAETNFKQKRERLYIKEIIVTEGRTNKRSMPRSRGRANPIKKRHAHITVHVDVKAAPKAKAEPKAKAAEPKAKVAAPKVETVPKKVSKPKQS